MHFYDNFPIFNLFGGIFLGSMFILRGVFVTSCRISPENFCHFPRSRNGGPKARHTGSVSSNKKQQLWSLGFTRKKSHLHTPFPKKHHIWKRIKVSWRLPLGEKSGAILCITFFAQFLVKIGFRPPEMIHVFSPWVPYEPLKWFGSMLGFLSFCLYDHLHSSGPHASLVTR